MVSNCQEWRKSFKILDFCLKKYKFSGELPEKSVKNMQIV